jgi:hypothetical protein
VHERRGGGLSWAAVLGWVCAILFVVSLWSGSNGGPLFWMGAISFDILMVGWVYVLVRWITRRVESRVRMSDGDI